MVITISTMATQLGVPGLSAYGASKAAVALLTKAWAAEYGPQGVRVNAVVPGPAHTPNAEAMRDDFEEAIVTISSERVADPKAVAEAVIFLASAGVSHANGPATLADSGRLAA
jgi:NAD(P)-dependent dehydrogenase (short-subunit alcohol dehydrogenase family)